MILASEAIRTMGVTRAVILRSGRNLIRTRLDIIDRAQLVILTSKHRAKKGIKEDVEEVEGCHTRVQEVVLLEVTIMIIQLFK